MIKSATVSARIDENIKAEAEDILQQLGIPVSVVINPLYHQKKKKKGIPFPMTLAKQIPSLEGMTRQQLDAKLEHSYKQAIARKGRPLKEVFDDLERKHS